MSWTDERVERLRTLWNEGLTATQIARELGGVSRNAVIGKVYRLGLSNRSPSPKGGDASGVTETALTPPQPREAKAVNGKARADAQKCESETVFVEKKEKARRAAGGRASGRKKAAAETVTGATKKGPVASSGAGDATETTVEAGQTRAAPAEQPSAKVRRPAAGETQATVAAATGERPHSRVEKAMEVVREEEAEPEALATVDDSAAALAAEAEKSARKLSLLELNERTCKWPIGDPSTNDFYFCGLRCAPEKPYCEAHAALAYQPMSSRRDRERTRPRIRAASA